MSESSTLGQVCPEGWVWDNENSECRCGAPVCPEGYAWDQDSRRCQPQPTWPPVQSRAAPPAAAAQALPTTTVAPAAVPTGCPEGYVWVASIQRCVSADSAWRFGVGEKPAVRVQAINPDGSTEMIDAPPDVVSTVGQEGDVGTAEATAPKPIIAGPPRGQGPIIAGPPRAGPG